MNIIILNKEEIINNSVTITGEKLKHILSYIKPTAGERLRAGILNGLTGEGTVDYIDNDRMALTLTLTAPPPSPLPLKLVLAMPRPKVLNRVIQHATAMGIKDIHIIKTWRVEKSYWESPMLDEKNLFAQMIAGLEQGRDTILPEIHIRKRFKPFVEDELPSIIGESTALVAHPVAEKSCPYKIGNAVTLTIGPEGGFIPYEIDALQRIGFTPVTLGERILRVETALPYIIGKLF